MQILTKQNIVIDYCEDGYISMGATVVCPTTQKTFENCTVVTVDSVPTDIEAYMYMYANGKFYRNDLVLREYVKLKLDKKADSTHKHSANDITSGTLPVARGGTEATTPAAARVNLGFTYGTEEPTGTPTTGEGSVYFMEDDGSPLPVSEGGTGAATVEGILANLGIADYIVERGTSGIWTYEKWNSGKAVCWGTIHGETGTFTSHGISVYYMMNSLYTSLPSNLFKTVSHAIPTMLNAGSGVLVPRTTTLTVSSVGVSFVRFYGGSDSLNIQYAVEVKGKWK